MVRNNKKKKKTFQEATGQPEVISPFQQAVTPTPVVPGRTAEEIRQEKIRSSPFYDPSVKTIVGSRGDPIGEPREVPQGEIFTDVKTGLPSGVETKEGTILGRPQDIEKVVAAQQAREARFPLATSAREQQIKQAEVERTTEEELPERRQLDPEVRTGEEIPLIGGIIAVIQNILAQNRKEARGEESFLSALFKVKDLNPSELRSEARTQIEKQVFEEGITESEKLGAIIEGIPIVGSLVGNYASGLVETPSGNVLTITRTLKGERGRATKYETWARTGVMSPEIAQKQIEEIELNVQRLESRIKMLINFSPELRFNSDYVNRVETEILRTKEVLLEAKLRTIQNQPVTADDYAYFEALANEREFEF